MGKRRSWSTLRGNAEMARAKLEAGGEQRTRLGEMLAAASKSYSADDVMKRLDAADARDREVFEAKWGER